MDSSAYSYFEQSKSKDPNAPTAIFLDDFRNIFVHLAPDTWMAHGAISLLGAQKAGYNTVGIEYNDPFFANQGHSDYSQPLNQIDADIHSGKLKGIGKGDVLNVSLVNPAPTFEEASSFLGFNVNAENLACEKDHILKRLGEIFQDQSRPEEDRNLAKRVIDTNRAIDKLQADGLTVIHSAGNEGPDRFSWDFLNAKVQLSSNKPSGEPDAFSASNSLTTKANGVLPVVLHAEIDPLDPNPISEQTGSFEIVGSGITMPNESPTPFIGNTLVFNRDKEDPFKPLAQADLAPATVTPDELLPNLSVQSPPPLASWNSLQNTPAFSGTPFLGIGHKFTNRILPPPSSRQYYLAQPGDQLVAGVVAGTSFSNIGYLNDHYADFKQAKAEATFGKLLQPSASISPVSEDDKHTAICQKR